MSVTQNNVFVHSSPPKAISSSGAAIRQLVKNGDLDKLEAAVLDGQGARLLGLAETTSDAKVKGFLRSVPGLMAKVDLIHEAVIRGSVRETQGLLDKKKLAGARDAVGRGIAHKAVLHSNKTVIDWLGKKYPEVLNLRDNEGRTCLHYAAACRDPEEMYDFLVSLGASENLTDIHGRKAEYYIKHLDEFDIEGPTRSLSRGKRRKISPTATTTTPPRKIMSSPPSITRAQIRILIHERDIPKLEKIVWSGHGEKLLLETTNNSKVRRFLDNVPHLLSRIKSIHTAAINNDVEFLKDVKRKTEVAEVFMAKDSHGLTPLHKAAGLSNRAVLEYLIFEAPALIHEADNDGRVPLHFAARDPAVYSWLVKGGGNENVVDNKGKTPGYYRSHQGELDTRYLRNIPDAPRVSGDLSGWDRSSPMVNQARRRPSNGDFSNISSSRDDSGKYGLSDNIELREEEFVVDEMMDGDYKTGSTTRGGLTNGGGQHYDDDFDESPPPEEEDVVVAPKPKTPPPPVPLSSSKSKQNSSRYGNTREKEIFGFSDEPENIWEKEKDNLDNMRMDAGELTTSIIEEAKSSLTPGPGSTKMEDYKRELEYEAVKESQPEANFGFDEVMPDADAEVLDPSAPGESVDLDYSELENGDRDREEEGVGPKSAYGSTKYKETGTDIEIALRNRNMEALVDMILDGRGSELLNQQTEHPDLKEFLSNVPAYMAKMASIHKAAAAGNLRELQTLLDRKRLALAKDMLGRSPLHQAVLHNHVNVARHIASNYPQSLRSLDYEGRSPLHYAATLSDSGSLYKYLVNLGADPNVKDTAGNTPGIYLRNRELLSNKDLIAAGGVYDIPVSIPMEKVVSSTKTGMTVQQPSSDQQYSRPPVDHWERPQTPPVAALSALEAFYASHLVKVESLWSRAWRRLSSHHGNNVKTLLRKFLTPEVFEAIKHRQTRNGCTLLDAIKFYPQYFLIAPDPESYLVFRELFFPAISDNNQFELGDGNGVKELHFGKEAIPQIEIPPVDIPSKFVTLVRMRLCRNIKPFALLPVMKKEDLNKVACALKTVKLNWPCFDLEVLDKEVREELKRRCWIPDATNVSRLWPKCRYFLLSHDNNAQIWMNAEDHLTLLVTSRYGRLFPMLETLNDIYLQFASNFDFYKLDEIGYVTVNPFRCGSGFLITFRIRLPTLMRDKSELADLAEELNLSLKWKNSTTPSTNNGIAPDDWIELENKTTLGLDEIDICKKTVDAINRLITLEEERARLQVLNEKLSKK